MILEKTKVSLFRVRLIKAENLERTDFVGASDPYAILQVGSMKSQTKTVKNSSNPEWFHTADFPIDANIVEEIRLKIEVFDHDTISKIYSIIIVRLERQSN